MPPMAKHQEYVEHLFVEPSDLPRVREEVEQYLHQQGLSAFVSDTCLVVTELLSNVYKHVPTDPRAILRVIPEDAQVRVVVSDNSHRVPRQSQEAPNWDAESGRGMWLIDQYTQSWFTVITGSGKSIDCLIPAPLGAAAVGCR